MAITLEQVERVREKTGASYEACRDALERTGGDMLDAVIYLEKLGQNQGKGTAYTYTTRPTASAAEDLRRAFTPPSGGGKDKKGKKSEAEWKETFRDLGEMGLNLLRHSTVNQLEVWRHEKLMTSVPVLILALLIILAFWITIPLLIVGLFMGCRYRFVGPDLGKEKINDVMDNVSATVDDMVGQVKREFNDSKTRAEEKAKKAESAARDAGREAGHRVEYYTYKAQDAAIKAERKVEQKMEKLSAKLDRKAQALSDKLESKARALDEKYSGENKKS